MNKERAKELISQYLDGELVGEDIELLNMWVKADETNARLFALRTFAHRHMYDRIQQKELADIQSANESAADWGFLDDSGVLDFEELMEMAGGSGDVSPVNITDQLLKKERDLARAKREGRRLHYEGVEKQLVRKGSIVIPRSLFYGGIAALLALFVLVGFSFEEEDTFREEAMAVKEVATPIAKLTDMEDLEWVLGAVAGKTELGTGLKVGYVEILSGKATLTFASGARVAVEGPSNFDLTAEGHMNFRRGRLAAYVPEEAKGFTVTTPRMQVVDLGTEFGMSVEAGGWGEVHVFTGVVTAAGIDASGKMGDVSYAYASEALGRRAGLVGYGLEKVAIDSTPFSGLMDHLGLLYRDLMVNGDFEGQDGAEVRGTRFGDVDNLKIAGWEDASAATVLNYDEAAKHDYPDPKTDEMAIDRGKNFYAGMRPGVIKQVIDISKLSEWIDLGKVSFEFNGWLGGFSNNSEHAIVRVLFMDSEGRKIGVGHLPIVGAEDRRNRSGFVYSETDGEIPRGTVSIVVEIETSGGGDNILSGSTYVYDAYVDNLKLKLNMVERGVR